MTNGRRFLLSIGAGLLLAGCASTSTDTAGGGGSLESVETADALRAQIDEAVAIVDLMERDHESPTFQYPARDVAFQVLSFASLPGWRQDDFAPALAAFRRSCARLRRLDDTTVLGGLASDISDWMPACEAADSVQPAAARAFFELAFAPVRIDPGSDAHMTSYFEPELEASRVRTDEFRFPIHARPPELTSRGGDYGVMEGGRLVPFFSRGEIYDGALDGRGLEIAYVADAVDLFFLHVQGSGRLRFQDGSTQRIAFAGKNGHEYRSAGREMMRRGLLRSASADAIQDFVREHPELGHELLAHNQSYIFFREVDGLSESAGPVGALGVQLTDGRSIAIDRRYTPLGAPVWLTGLTAAGPIQRLVIAQDTGSAIRGAQRADFFWGSGDHAGLMAGRTNDHTAELIVLLPTATVQRLTGGDG